jgi:excisionase family DNA binding protein
MLEEFLTVSEAASLMGVSRQRMYDVLDSHKIETHKLGPLRLVHRDDLNKLPRPRNKKAERQAG